MLSETAAYAGCTSHNDKDDSEYEEHRNDAVYDDEYLTECVLVLDSCDYREYPCGNAGSACAEAVCRIKIVGETADITA